MSEPPIPPESPSPIEPGRPFTGQPKPAPSGCSRPLLIGCGIVIVLLGIAAIVFIVKAPDLFAWGLGSLREGIVAKLPDDLTDAERARLDRGFDAVAERVKGGEPVEPPALKALQRQLMSATEKANAGTLTRDDVLDLLSALERVGGLLPEEAPARPATPTEPASDPEPAAATT